MKLIVGLGNPGKEYEKTRHNVGFIAVDICVQQIQDSGFRIQEEFKHEDKFNAEVAQGEINGEKVILAKPQTFMNNSGEAVKKIADFYKIAPEDIIIVHDDMDISSGDIRVKNDGSSAGHNGVQSIIDHLGTDAVKRIRIGIGRPTEGIPAEKYVLQKFEPEELKTVQNAIKEGIEQIKMFL